MQTLIVRYNGLVRLLVTNHPSYRYTKLVEQMPVPIELFGVTPVKAKDIKARFANRHAWGEWYRLNEEMEQFLSSIIHQ